MKIGEMIKENRVKKNMTQEDLAKKLFVSRPLVSKWETGKSYPDLHQLIQLSDFFEISLDELMREDIHLVNKKDNYVKKGIAWENWNNLVGLILVWLAIDIGFNFFEGNELFDIDYAWYFRFIMLVLIGTILWHNFLEKLVKKLLKID
ncbi:helix-turn-helix transcriptional regulator [Vagococcus carniphilus]|uniref:Helix-turn-helix transcriptional regulator n=1 Tax=Vagococcus carniphilus TaxID=218144 RepID=A0AAW8U5M5_9ENTE|nr:helix-turn-helix transcriptional regulator [Vagococcus carniphilus]MDT2834121.1 helix-turn-helix transcriptional regulator [Vagococcus carniphilus]MDT2848920.1 helix-turn-helix transcriptional regulator [Vagococcus carniphilus]